MSVDLSEIGFPLALNHLEEVRFSQSSNCAMWCGRTDALFQCPKAQHMGLVAY